MNRRVLVTGATRGIGRELVRQLSERGFAVFATGRDEGALESLKRETGCSGSTADLSDAGEALALYAEARTAMGRIDVLINNAGMNRRKTPIAELDVEEWNAHFALNLRAPALLCREALREMSERSAGHVVNVVSTIALTSQPNYALYAATKYALKGFTKCLIKEAREVGVKVTAVYPGGTDTDFRPEARPDYMRPASAAKMIVECVCAPEDVVVHELVYRPPVESNF